MKNKRDETKVIDHSNWYRINDPRGFTVYLNQKASVVNDALMRELFDELDFVMLDTVDAVFASGANLDDVNRGSRYMFIEEAAS